MTPSAKTARRVADAIEVMILKADRLRAIQLVVDAAPVGRRQLERDFNSLGTRLAREMRRVRIELAVGELISPQAASIQVRGIALGQGFSSERRLREATQGAYGLTPAEIRRGTRIERARLTAEAARRKKVKRPARQVWASERRRRRDLQAFSELVRKANGPGQDILVGKVLLPRAKEAKKEAAVLAEARVHALFSDVRAPLRSVA